MCLKKSKNKRQPILARVKHLLTGANLSKK
jgi:hypothetical protein